MFETRPEAFRGPNQRAMSKYTAFRCPEDILEAAKAKATANRRSLSNYIITLLEADVADELAAIRERPAKPAKPPGRKKTKQ